MSRALVWSWLIYMVDVPAGWGWERVLSSMGEQGHELMMSSIRVHWAAFTLVGVLLFVGMWNTAKARDSVILRQALALFVAQWLLDNLSYIGLITDVLPWDSLLLDFTPLVSVVLWACGGAFVILHAQREGASTAALLLPILAHVGMLSGMALHYAAGVFDFELQRELFSFVGLGMQLFYWSSWLAIPRESLSLEAPLSEHGEH